MQDNRRSGRKNPTHGTDLHPALGPAAPPLPALRRPRRPVRGRTPPPPSPASTRAGAPRTRPARAAVRRRSETAHLFSGVARLGAGCRPGVRQFRRASPPFADAARDGRLAGGRTPGGANAPATLPHARDRALARSAFRPVPTQGPPGETPPSSNAQTTRSRQAWSEPAYLSPIEARSAETRADEADMAHPGRAHVEPRSHPKSTAGGPSLVESAKSKNAHNEPAAQPWP